LGHFPVLFCASPYFYNTLSAARLVEGEEKKRRRNKLASYLPLGPFCPEEFRAFIIPSLFLNQSGALVIPGY